MVGEAIDNNVVTISGKVATELKYSHEIYGEGFYQFILDVPRLSDSSDSISITISERLIGKRELVPGALVNIEGQFRSYNSFGENGSKLLLTVFARELSFTDDESQIRNSNKIYLNGFICKKPVYRSTPFGREITDLLIAVNRAYNKSDYIPCISWGRNARFCSTLNVGDNIRIWGRIQSRAYQKKMPDGSAISRVAYEVSLSKLEIADAKRPGRDSASDESGNPGMYGAGLETQQAGGGRYLPTDGLQSGYAGAESLHDGMSAGGLRNNGIAAATTNSLQDRYATTATTNSLQDRYAATATTNSLQDRYAATATAKGLQDQYTTAAATSSLQDQYATTATTSMLHDGFAAAPSASNIQGGYSGARTTQSEGGFSVVKSIQPSKDYGIIENSLSERSYGRAEPSEPDDGFTVVTSPTDTNVNTAAN